MAKAHLRHILVNTECEGIAIKTLLDAGADFQEMARKHSKCPTSANGGELGIVHQGQMEPEFDKVAYYEELGWHYGPVKTVNGWHLIHILSREADDVFADEDDESDLG